LENNSLEEKLKLLATTERASIKQPTHESNLESKNLEEGGNEEVIRNLSQNRKLRKIYAMRLFVLLCIWLGLILAIIILQGFQIIKLADSVLITLITTTTANVAAYFLVVTKYLFPNK